MAAVEQELVATHLLYGYIIGSIPEHPMDPMTGIMINALTEMDHIFGLSKGHPFAKITKLEKRTLFLFQEDAKA